MNDQFCRHYFEAPSSLFLVVIKVSGGANHVTIVLVIAEDKHLRYLVMESYGKVKGFTKLDELIETSIKT